MALASRRLKGATKPEGRNTTRLAVLIDGDNTSAKHAQAIFDEIVKLGEATVRRIYGDFSHGRLSGWDGAIKSLAILQHQQRSNSRGKNASDIALVIDAVDLMYKRTLDGVVLVSSDSDFTRLAQRLREEGLVVYGFGERQCRIRHCRSPNTNVGNRASNQFARATADTYLNGTPKDPPPVRVADQVFTQFADEVARASGPEKREEFIASLRETVRQQPDFTTFPSSRRSGSYEEAIHTQVMAPLIPSESDRSRKRQPTPPTSCSGNPASLVSLAMKLSGKLPHELTEDDIMLAGQYEGSIISNVISEVFATYKVGQFIWAHKRIETEEVPYATVLAECRREYPPPWETSFGTPWQPCGPQLATTDCSTSNSLTLTSTN